MNLILKGRGVELNDRLRGYATDKLTKTQRFFERIIKMEVELSQERNPRVKDKHKVEVTVKTPGHTLRAHGAGGDYFAAIDQAASRLESQVRKVKERLTDRSVKGESSPSVEEEASFDLEDEEGPRIVRLQQQPTKPMTAEEAALELDAEGMQFLLFTEAESMSPAVVYRRGDGAYGIITYSA